MYIIRVCIFSAKGRNLVKSAQRTVQHIWIGANIIATNGKEVYFLLNFNEFLVIINCKPVEDISPHTFQSSIYKNVSVRFLVYTNASHKSSIHNK